MSSALRLRPEAETDLADAAQWYERQSAGLGFQFLDAIEASFASIQSNPRLHPVIHRDTRRALIRRFPFGVYYRIDTNGIVVVAIMHASRDPRRWKGRD